tara:strand:- start:1459 stop:2460 length:1002 start_codon:yes stop_codon:yes gene_type:complete
MGDNNTRLLNWLEEIFLDREIVDISPLREQASFREFFRVKTKHTSYIACISPPDREQNENFIYFSNFYKEHDIKVPKIEAFDESNGFFLLEDFGDSLVQKISNKESRFNLINIAIEEIIKIQNCPTEYSFKKMDRKVSLMQMKLFETWFLKKFLQVEINRNERVLLDKVYKDVNEHFFNCPQVLCHFDFETRNLMDIGSKKVGVLDYQDSLVGPIFLDLVSLLKDLDYPLSEEEQMDFLKFYIKKSNKNYDLDKQSLLKSKEFYDIVGLQRQLRILGTLARLHLRDAKSFRLVDLPKTLEYVLNVTEKYRIFEEFNSFLKSRIEKILKDKIRA